MSSRIRAFLLMAVVLAILACGNDPNAGANSTNPEWIYRDPQRPNRTAVVFVHGIFGDTKRTWAPPDKPALYDYLHRAPDLGEKVDVYAFGFTSKMIGDGSLSPGEAASKLYEFLDADGVLTYDQVVFVAHSMGGLVTMRLLVLEPTLREKVPLLVFFATPHEGSQITDIAEHVTENPAIRAMLPADENLYLQQLNEDWTNVRKSVTKPTMVCAYEKKKTGPVIIVPWTSSTRNCDERPIAIEDSNHISIVKPDSDRHPSVIFLRNALSRHAMPFLSDTSWKTYGIERSRDPWEVTITNAGSRNVVTFSNTGTTRLMYSVTADDDESILVTPSVMPRYVSPGARDSVDLVLLNPLRETYSLKLRLGLAPIRQLTARVPSLDEAKRQRQALYVSAAREINRYLADPAKESVFRNLDAQSQYRVLVDLTSEAIGHQKHGWPQVPRLALAADTLSDLGLSGGTSSALASIKISDPGAIDSAGLRRVAGVLATRTGDTAQVSGWPTMQVSIEDAASPADFSFLTSAERSELSTLALKLRDFPETRQEATVLAADIQSQAGRPSQAYELYRQAERMEPTLVVSERLKKLEYR